MLILSSGWGMSVVCQNLVPNPSFEDTINCPAILNQFEVCSIWQNFGNSPDYFNSCATNGLNVPNAVFGFQNAHSGTAMAGLISYLKPGLPGTPNYRELIGVQLTIPLNMGTVYYFSMYANFAFYNNHPIAANKIGARFSTIPYDSCCPPPINNFAHIYSNAILSDSIAWIKIQGSLTADSAYSYLSLGNFFDDASTDTLILSTVNYDAAYYYLDDICVSTDSLFCELWTGVNDYIHFEQSAKLYPNPTNKKITFSSPIEVSEIRILNFLGQEIYKIIEVNDKMIELDIEFLENGIYFLISSSSKGAYYNKFNIIHY